MSQRRSVVAYAPWLALATLVYISLFVGVINIDLRSVLTDPDDRHVLIYSRVPRTAALALAGAAMAVSGLIMQHLTRNRFVAPTTAGTVDAAAVGLLVATVWFATAPVMGKVLIALIFALAGTAVFVFIVQRIRFKDVVFVPLLGLVLGGAYRAIAEFAAFRHELTQALNSWFTADFSGIIQGRYETLWLAGLVAAAAYLFANRFTAAGMGESFATNIGVNYRLVMAVGLAITAFSTAVVVVTVGAIPFLGLIVPNLVTMALGDNIRRVLPVTALVGASAVLACDIFGRLVIAPYEIPVGTILGVLGSAVFLYLVMSRKGRFANA